MTTFKLRLACVCGLALVGFAGFTGCGAVDTAAGDGGTEASASQDSQGPAADSAPGDAAPPPSDAPPPDSTPGDGAPGDASTCINLPKVGDPCVAGQKSCEKVDGCCIPQVVCDTAKGTWELLYLRCPCVGIPCGSLTCSGTQFCRTRASGIDGGRDAGLMYECTDYPPACERQWTCACVMASSAPVCSPPISTCRDQGGRPYQACGGM